MSRVRPTSLLDRTIEHDAPQGNASSTAADPRPTVLQCSGSGRNLCHIRISVRAASKEPRHDDPHEFIAAARRIVRECRTSRQQCPRIVQDVRACHPNPAQVCPTTTVMDAACVANCPRAGLGIAFAPVRARAAELLGSLHLVARTFPTFSEPARTTNLSPPGLAGSMRKTTNPGTAPV